MKRNANKKMGSRGLGSAGMGQRQVACCYETVNISSDFSKGWKFLDMVRNDQLRCASPQLNSYGGVRININSNSIGLFKYS
jgi:hypothetical protein